MEPSEETPTPSIHEPAGYFHRSCPVSSRTSTSPSFLPSTIAVKSSEQAISVMPVCVTSLIQLSLPVPVCDHTRLSPEVITVLLSAENAMNESRVPSLSSAQICSILGEKNFRPASVAATIRVG